MRTGVAIVEFQTTMQPSDNFSVVAGSDETYLSGLVPAADGIDLKDANNIEIPVTTSTTNECSAAMNKACRTDMLTVWRRVHLEVDRMGSVGTNNNVTGTTDGEATIPPSNGLTNGVGTVAVNLTDLRPQRFAFGRFLTAETDLVIFSNTNSSVTVLNTTRRAIHINDGTSFTLYDDDDYNNDDSPFMTTGNPYPYLVDGDESEQIVQTDESFAYLLSEDGIYSNGRPKNVYASAYVMPEYAWAQDAGYCQTGIAFKLNVEESLVGSKIDENRNSSADEKDAFWVGYFLIAYQGEESEDADGTPANSGIVPGNAVCDCFSAGTCVGTFCASAIPKGGIGGLIYLEVMQDITRSYKLLGVTVSNQGVTAPHELGHQFGLKGDNMNPIVGQPPRANATYEIMDYPNRAGGQADSYTLHPEHINLIRRRVKSPGV